MSATGTAQRPPLRRRHQRTPTVYQMTATDCGAACLSMVMGHFGRVVPLQVVREQAGVGRDGATAAGIKRAATHNHMDFAIHRIAVDEARSVPTPFIAYWQGRHFVVVEGRTRGGWRVNDPAQGPTVIPDQQWAQDFSGVALSVVPGPGFTPTSGGADSFWSSLQDMARGTSGPVAGIVALGVAQTIPALLIPALAAVFINEVLIASQTAWLPVVIAGMLLLAGLATALRVEQGWLTVRTAVPLSARLSGRLMWQLLREPLSFFEARPVGGLIQRVARAGSIAGLVSRSLPGVLIGAISMAILFVAIVWWSPTLAAVALVAAGLNAVALLAVSRQRVSAAQRLQAGQFRLASHAMMGIRNLESIKTQGGGGQFLSRFMGYQADVLTTHQRLERVTAYVEVAPQAIRTLTSVGLLVVGAAEVMSGALSVGGVLAVMMLTNRFLAPIPGFLRTGTEVQDSRATVSQLQDILSAPSALAATPEQATTAGGATVRGQIDLTNVSFHYPGSDLPLLRDISLQVEPGDQLVIVGASGSGKSTLCNVICGVLPATAGVVRLDGVPVPDWPRQDLAAALLKVEQAPHLFEGTVADNLTMWRDDLSDAALRQALADAAADEVVAARGGLLAVVASDGKNFSGGQAQRIALARALAREPAVLILDEATSALDAQTQAKVLAALRRRQCTTIRVVHDLASIAADEDVVVMDQGRIVERGCRQTLASAGGLFARMAAMQNG